MEMTLNICACPTLQVGGNECSPPAEKLMIR
jgi:hypothetical protein